MTNPVTGTISPDLDQVGNRSRRTHSPRRSAAPRPPSRRLIREVLITIFIGSVGIVWLYPFLWMVSASVKDNTEIFGSVGLLTGDPQWDNYTRAWFNASIGRAFWNSMAVTVGTIAIVVAVSALLGYALGRYKFIGRKTIIALLAVTVLVPEGYTVIPIFGLVQTLGLGNSLFGVILAESGGANIIVILLFAGYFAQLPRELEDAARMDGAGFFRIFWQVMLPLAKPVIATGIILTAIRSWNSFLIPLVLTLPRPELRTLAVGIYSFKGEYATDIAAMAAASTIGCVPIVIAFLFLQRYFISGIAGAIKG